MSGKLTEAEVAQFRELGYLYPYRAMTPEAAAGCAAKLAEYERILGEDPQRYFKIKAHIAAPWMVDLARNPAILDAVESLIGPNILLFGSSLFAKRAKDSRFVSWHQDSAYYGLDPHDEVTVWVAFTPSRKANGCLRVLPGSHKGPDRTHEETYDPENLLARGQTITDVDDDASVYMELEAGEFSIHHERTVHGSLGNQSGEPRIGLAFFYMPAATRSTLGRRTALLVRGEDRHGHWDADPLPKRDLDPETIEILKAAWAQYQDRAVKQASAVPPH